MKRQIDVRPIGVHLQGHLRLGVVSADERRTTAMEALTTALRLRGVALVTRFLPTYGALYEAMDGGACEVAWAPPLVALDLVRCAAALPIARPVRAGQTSYYSVLLGRAGGGASLERLRGSRVAWVAPESAAGHVVPRLGLRALGIDPDRTFRSEAFFGNHAAAIQALRAGAVDFAATHATLVDGGRRLLVAADAEGLPVVAAHGPIPSDVVAVSTDVDPEWQRALRRALTSLVPSEVQPLARAMVLDGFEETDASHLAPLEGLAHRSMEQALRPFAQSSAWA